MKIRMRRNKQKRTVTISFRAETDREGVALKNAVLAVGKDEFDSGMPARLVEELLKEGVDKADFDLGVVTPKKRRAESHET